MLLLIKFHMDDLVFIDDLRYVFRATVIFIVIETNNKEFNFILTKTPLVLDLDLKMIYCSLNATLVRYKEKTYNQLINNH